MAILMEEEKRKIDWFILAIIVAIVVILSSAIYYIFFINPSTIEVIIPSRLKLLQETEQLIKFDPNEVLNNSALKNEPQVKIIIPEPALNPNPFLR
ncbi:MAG: hypothetical protein AAB396_00640 [Patescibacteria group bacterium]